MFGQRVLCVITGASRGYGRALAVALAEAVSAESVFLLLARDAAGLAETRARMLAVAPGLRVETRAVDLEAAEAAALSECLSAVPVGGFEAGLLVHNAGSIGWPSLRASEHADRARLLSYCGLNVASPVLLTSAYLSRLRTAAARHVVVNVSSLAAVQPMASLSLYCAGKAARDAFFGVLAAEEVGVRVLSWAPGPMATDIVAEVAAASFDAQMRRSFADPNFGIDMAASAKALLQLLHKDEFASGAHIDIFDVWRPEAE